MNSLAVFLSRLAGVAWMVDAGFLLFVTALFLPVIILTAPWATAMVVVGRPLLGSRWSTPRVAASVALAVGSLALVSTFRDQDLRAWVLVPSLAGVASLLALALHRIGAGLVVR